MRIAIFDFDGTIYANETFQLLMRHLKEHPTYANRYNQFYKKLLPTYIGYKLKLQSKSKMRTKSMQSYMEALSGLTTSEMNHFFQGMQGEVIEDFHKEVIQLVHTHHQSNVQTILVSGAYLPFLQAVTNELPFTTIIGTNIPISNDKVDGSKQITHVQGEQKKIAVQQLFQKSHVDWENSFSYGDSFSDLSVLSIVGNPVAVCPDKQLNEHALKLGWEIIQ